MTDKRKKRPFAIALAALALAAGGCGNLGDAGEEAMANTAKGSQAVAPAAALVLAENGVTQYAIVTAAAARPAEQTAAKELAEYLKKVTGVEFKIVAESATEPQPAKAIHLGWTAFAASHGIDCAKLGQEESVIKTFGDNLVITGGRPRGTLYGVYDFLQKDLGVHWLDRDTEVVPKRPTLALNAIDRRAKPVFRMRNLYTAPHYLRFDGVTQGKNIQFRFRNRQNVQTWTKADVAYGGYDDLGYVGMGCHNFGAYIPSDKYFAEHPDYYALDKDGKTRLPTGKVGEPKWTDKGSICLTHPEVRKIALAKLLETIAADRAKFNTPDQPPPEIYSISQPDNDVVCHCPSCRAMVEREGAESGPFLDFVNEIADGVRANHPEVKLQYYAYWWSMVPPKTIRPRDNVCLWWCDWYMPGTPQPRPEPWQPLTAPSNAWRAENLRQWAAITPGGIMVWDYGQPYAYPGFPFICEATLADDFRFFADCNATIGLFLETEESTPWEISPSEGEFCGAYRAIGQFSQLYNWLAMQLMVDPRQPVEPLLSTFMRGYYGPAATAMRALYDKLVAAQRTLPTRATLKGDMLKIPYLTPAFHAEIDALLETAESACAPGSMELLHVQYERLRSDSALLGNWYALARKLAPGDKMPFERAAVITRIERRAQPVMTGLGYPEKCLTEKFGAYWQKPLAEYIADWRAGGTAAKTAEIEVGQ